MPTTDNAQAPGAPIGKLCAFAVVGLLAAAASLSVAAELGLPQPGLVLALSLTPIALYVAISQLITRPIGLSTFEVSDRSVPALWNGMGAAAGALPASFLFVLAGVLYALGYDGLAYVLGWGAGLALAAIAVGPYLRRSGARTLAQFFAMRFGAAVGIAAAAAIAVVSFLLLAAETSLAGLILARYLDIGMWLAVMAVVVVVVLCTVFGGMSALARAQVPQYLVIAAAYVGTLVYFTASKHGALLPQISYGEALAEISRLETTMLEKGLADLRTFQPHVKPFLQIDRLNFFALTLTVMAGAAALPHILGRYFAVATSREARLSGAWTAFFLLLLLATAPAYAAYAKLEIYSLIAKGTALTALPPWLEPLSQAGLVRIHGVSLKMLDDVIGALRAGHADVAAIAAYLKAHGLDTASAWMDLKPPVKTAILDAARTLSDAAAFAEWDALQKSVLPAAALAAGNKTGFLTHGALTLEPAAVIAAIPGMAAAPWIVVGLLGAGLASAIVATTSSLALTIATALGDVVNGLSNDRDATAGRRLAATRIFIVVAAALAAAVAATAPTDTMGALLSALSLAAATLFPALILGIWWRRANGWGAAAGMVVGLAVCAYYLIATRYFPVSFYETWPELSNASDAAVRKFLTLKSAWEGAAEGDAKMAAWSLLEAHARGTAAKVGVANWFGIHGGAAALFALPASIVTIVVVSLVTPRPPIEIEKPKS